MVINNHSRNLTRYELETVINFNKGDNMATIFTYEKMWQRHIEKKLGIKPYLDNGYGGKSYKLPKSKISKPRASMKLTDEQRKAISERFSKIRCKSKT